MTFKTKQHPRWAFVQAPIAPFANFSKSHKPSGFLIGPYGLRPNVVPQLVAQMTNSIRCLWSAEPAPHSVIRFVAPTDSTRLEGIL
ncbi:hypothetical protein Nstercoris_00265 [Nitrosomonas stercoris]|uniref:Uncharacterized protein n=1 Tax=Nitrosomonas stercoris TaxID=1444684 RepID=A0A4Y1YIX8_9PROT|nr:hypothetical protein Nstercoris_00265 [Nitrosomonas stercoris]